jgi:hypothetical protein
MVKYPSKMGPGRTSIVPTISAGMILLALFLAISCSKSAQSRDMGAEFPAGEVQVKYVSASTTITRSQAATIAKGQLKIGYSFNTDGLPADATVALYMGRLQGKGDIYVSDVPPGLWW